MPDTREAVMINKLALEYRQIRSLAGMTNLPEGGAAQLYQGLKNKQVMDLKTIREWTKSKKRENYETLRLSMVSNHTLQHHFRQATP